MDIIKNPIIIGLFAGTLTYIYFKWQLDEKNKKRHKKGRKKEEINLIIPLVISIIVWFVSYAYFDSISENIISEKITSDIGRTRISMPLPIAPSNKYKFVKDVISESSDPKSFSLLTSGVTIPSKLPDVLLDLF